MADIDRLPSGRWQSRWRDDGGRQRKSSHRTKALAQQHLADVAHDKARGQYVDERGARATLAAYAQAYIATRPQRASTQARCRSHLIHVGASALGQMSLGQIRPSHVQAWVTELSRELAPATTRVTLGFVRAVFNAAVDDRLLARSPVPRRIALPRPDAVEQIVPLTVGQVMAVAGRMPPRARAMVIAQAGLGPRVQELLALREGSDVCFLRREVRFSEQLHPRRRTRERLKTPGSVRTVPLPGVVGEALSEHIRRFGTGPDGLIFTMHDHAPWQYDRVRSMVLAATEDAGVPRQAAPTHCFRHHYASVLLAAGEPVIAVAERLGHSTAALVLSTYGHLMPDSEDRTRRAIDEAWSACAPGVPRDAVAGR